MATEQSPLIARPGSGGGSGEAEAETGNQETPDRDWKPPKQLRWIQAATWANVFLSGFDGTIAASTYAVIGSDFGLGNQASWISTSYLITATAFQPLYGRFSDILGRRTCFFAAVWIFMIGSLLCGVANSMVALNVARAIAGVGGGGLMTMATVILSDLIPFYRRGLYQAANNVMYGFGGACGASLGGVIANYIGWRYAFLFQIPVGLFGLTVAYLFIPKTEDKTSSSSSSSSPSSGSPARTYDRVKQLDLLGATALVSGLATQLAALSLGGNAAPWGSVLVLSFLVASIVLLALFLLVEAWCARLPIMPMRMLKGQLAVANFFINIFAGAGAFSYIFTVPLFFQAVLLESSAKAGARLVVPSMMFPVGGIVAGMVMSRWGYLSFLVRAGTLVMALGISLSIFFNEHSPRWSYFVFLIPANLGQGITYPSSLFTMLAAFSKTDQAVATSTVYLFRNIGAVWGIAVTSAITQNLLARKLAASLTGVPEAEQIIDSVRHSVEAIREVPEVYRAVVIRCYVDSLRWAFVTSTVFGALAFLASLSAKGSKLERPEEDDTEDPKPGEVE